MSGLSGLSGLSSGKHFWRRQRGLGLDSIKAALDTLPAGVCYFTAGGMVKLCNLQMQRLFRTMAQSDLQSLDELHRTLRECDQGGGAPRIPGDEAAYLFPDGQVWLFTQNSIQAADGSIYIEAIFSEVTQLYQKKLEIEAQTERLREINRKLQLLSSNVATLTREEEMLAFKTRLHDSLGAGLVAARQSLLHDRPADGQGRTFRLWQQSLALLRQDNQSSGGRGDLSDLYQDAAALGVGVELEGVWPQPAEARQVFVQALRECLTNCVRHGGGTQLYAVCSHEQQLYRLTVSNNGRVPAGDIVPGGGLTDLRQQLERCGGQLLLQSQPIFRLTAIIPQQEGEEL